MHHPHHTNRLLSLAIAACLSAPAAFAGDNDKQAQQNADNQSEAQLSGIIDGVKRMDIGDEQRRVVRIRLSDGSTELVDVGSVDESSRLQLNQGSRIMVRGCETEVDDRSVIKADRIRIRQSKRMAKRQGEQNKVQGPIKNIKDLGDESGFLVEVRCADSDNKLVHLPSQLQVDRSELRNAEALRVMGSTKQQQGKEVFVADRLKLHDKSQLAKHGHGYRMEPQKQGGQYRDQSQQRRMHAQQARRQQEQQTVRQRQGAQYSGRQQQESRNDGTVQFSGVLDGTKRLKNRSGKADKQLVRLRMRDGSSRVVDLGNVNAAKSLKLQQGDRVSVSGQRKKMGDREVIVARRLRIGGSGESQQNMTRYYNRDTQRSQQQRRFQLSGTVEAVKTVTMNGQGDERKLLRVKLQNGKSMTLNIKPSLNRSILQIDQGDSVAAFGDVKQTRDRKLHMVDAIMITDRE